VSWRVVEHTADVGLEAEGADLAEAVEEVIAGFGHLVCPEAEVGIGEQRRLEVEAPSRADLVVDLLDELNFVHQTERFLPAEAEVAIAATEDGCRLDATIEGETYERDRHGHLMEIKATTYHGLEVEDGRIAVLFDV
jgi:SHS2 domain-containing protein